MSSDRSELSRDSGPARRSSPSWLFLWTSLAVVACAVDYYAESYLHFPMLATIPVLLAAWHSGLLAGLCFAIGLPLVRLYFTVAVWVDPAFLEALTNAAVRIVVLGLLALLADSSARKTRLLAARVNEIEGLLPICGFCKSIRDPEGDWQPLEVFVSRRTDATFSHGLCPKCAKLQYGDLGSGLEEDEEPGERATVGGSHRADRS